MYIYFHDKRMYKIYKYLTINKNYSQTLFPKHFSLLYNYTSLVELEFYFEIYMYVLNVVTNV